MHNMPRTLPKYCIWHGNLCFWWFFLSFNFDSIASMTKKKPWTLVVDISKSNIHGATAWYFFFLNKFRNNRCFQYLRHDEVERKKNTDCDVSWDGIVTNVRAWLPQNITNIYKHTYSRNIFFYLVRIIKYIRSFNIVYIHFTINFAPPKSINIFGFIYYNKM